MKKIILLLPLILLLTVSVVSAANNTNLNTGLIFFYNFNESSGQPLDYSGNGLDTDVTSGSDFTYSNTLTDGIRFNPAGSKFTTSHDASMNIGTGAFTSCVHASWDSATTSLTAGKDSYGDNPYSGFYIWRNSNDLTGTVRNQSTGSFSSTYTVGAGLWSYGYACLVRNSSGSTWVKWVSGGAVNNGTTSVATHDVSNDDPFQVGSNDKATTGANMFDGNMTRLGLWNRVLNDSELLQLLNPGGTPLAAPFVADPVGNFFDELSFVSQNPSDITDATPFSWATVNITYQYFNTSNLTQPYEINQTIVTNLGSCAITVNGSCSRLNFTWEKKNPVQTINDTDGANVTYEFDENDLFPHTENFEVFADTPVYATQFLSLSGTGLDDWHAEKMLNFSTAVQNYELLVEIPIWTNGLANIYLANSSAVFEQSDPDLQAGVVDICSITSATQGNHTHSYNGTVYNHTLCRVTISGGQIDGTAVTPNMTILIRATAGTSQLFAITDLVRANSARSSTNDGSTWTDSNNAFTHVHLFNSADETRFQAFSNRSDGVFLNSSVRSDAFDINADIPRNPDIQNPPNGAQINATVNITYLNSSSYIYYNISVLNSDLSFNKTLTQNNSDALSYQWDIWNEAERYSGVYFIKVEAINSEGTASDTHEVNITRNTVINVTARTSLGNVTINTFEGWVYNLENDDNVSYSVTNGQALVSTYNGNVTVYMDAANYSLNQTLTGVNHTAGKTDVQFYLFETNTINITFYDEANPTVVLSGPLIEIDLISDIFAANYSTTNGTLYLTLLQPATYTMRYSAPNFQERFYTFTLTNRTYNTINLYLINDSVASNVTVFVYDDITNPIEGVLVHALKYDLATNSYILQEIGTTDVAGKTIMSLTFNDEFYKFQAYYEDTLRFTSEPAYITTDEYTIQLNLDEEIAEEIFNYWTISGTLVFNTATNNFRLDFGDTSGIASEFCVEVDRYRNITKTDNYNSSCTTGASGTILVGVEAENGTRYDARAYYVEDGDEKFLADESYTYPADRAGLGANGLIMQAIFTTVIALLAFKSLALAAAFIPLTLILGNMAGLNQFSMAALIAIQAVGVFLAYIFSKKG